MQSKGVHRYRRGQVPKWAKEEGQELPPDALGKGAPAKEAAAALVAAVKSSSADTAEDRRLRRAAQRPRKGDHDDEEASRRRHEAEVVYAASSAATEAEEARGARARRAVAEVAASSSAVRRQEGEESQAGEEEEEEETKEEEESRRRKRLKEKLKAEQEEEEEVEELPKLKDEEEEEEEEEEEDRSEYETDTSDSDEEGYRSRRPVLAPTFVRKQDRETIRERELKEQEEEALQAQKEEERKKHRLTQTRELLVEAIQKERTDPQQEGEGEEQSEEESDESDEEEEQAEFEKWKIRELKRIKRDQEEKLKWEKDQQELERRRGLSDAEIARLDAEALQPREKKKWRFLQKYYHKGAFYQEEEVVKEIDYAEPTLEDRFDKTILPKVMQVKNFGRAGRTKWTHLVDQDTTYLGGGKANPFTQSSSQTTASTTTATPSDRWDPWSFAPNLHAKYTQRMGGMGSVDDPLHRKRKKPDGQ